MTSTLRIMMEFEDSQKVSERKEDAVAAAALLLPFNHQLTASISESPDFETFPKIV